MGRSDLHGWAPLPQAPFFANARLDCALSRLHGVLSRRHGDGWQLAIPFDRAVPFPLIELFCFAAPCRISGQKYIVYTFNAQKTPIF